MRSVKVRVLVEADFKSRCAVDHSPETAGSDAMNAGEVVFRNRWRKGQYSA